MAIAVIKRLGFKADSGAFMANALKVAAGAKNVKITLRGQWRTLQGNVVLNTPCPAHVFSNGDIEADYNSALVRPDAGGTMDIEARIERVVTNG
jgi:hypothetical protein